MRWTLPIFFFLFISTGLSGCIKITPYVKDVQFKNGQMMVTICELEQAAVWTATAVGVTNCREEVREMPVAQTALPLH